MKKFMIGVGILITLLLVLGFVFRDTIGMMLAFAAMQPDQGFAEDTRHEAPDYSQFGAWAALPSQDDMADVTPSGAENLQAQAAVDVFFIHPTTYYKNEFWLQPLDDADANRITDEQVMRGQAAVFNTCCAVYAPRYRQATFFLSWTRVGMVNRQSHLPMRMWKTHLITIWHITIKAGLSS